MDNLKARWRGLATREQQMIFMALIVLVVGIFYWGIWSPIATAEMNASRQLLTEQKTLDYVKLTANKIIALKKNSGANNYQGSLSSAVTQGARRYNIDITRMQPQGNKIQLWMDDVSFDSLLGYLNDLVLVKGLSLDSIDLAASDTAGYVQVRRIQLSQ